MEAGNHLQVLHASFNYLKWLQRDFNILALPVVDTQIMYRKIKSLQGKQHEPNISLVNIARVYFPSMAVNKNCTFADFRKRPIPQEIKIYATLHKIHLFQMEPNR